MEHLLACCLLTRRLDMLAGPPLIARYLPRPRLIALVVRPVRLSSLFSSRVYQAQRPLVHVFGDRCRTLLRSNRPLWTSRRPTINGRAKKHAETRRRLKFTRIHCEMKF